MFPPATLPRLVACSLALLWLGVGPAAAQQQAAVVTVLYDGVARPAFCDRQSFVFLSTIQGPLLRPHTVDMTRSDPIDLVLVRRRFNSGQREEVRVPGLKPESSSDLELHCHQRIAVIDESSISAAFAWRRARLAGRSQSGDFAHSFRRHTDGPAGDAADGRCRPARAANSISRARRVPCSTLTSSVSSSSIGRPAANSASSSPCPKPWPIGPEAWLAFDRTQARAAHRTERARRKRSPPSCCLPARRTRRRRFRACRWRSAGALASPTRATAAYVVFANPRQLFL